jgi:hypothetical protein
MSPGIEGDAEMQMDAHDAMSIVKDTQQRATRALEVQGPLLYLAWAFTMLLAYGALWWTAVDEHPYRGFSQTGLGGLLVVILFVCMAIRLALVGRALNGVSGVAVRQWAIFASSLAVGMAALWLEAGALLSAGASRAIVGVLIATAPMFAVGLVLTASAAIRLDWPSFALGVWLLAAGTAGAFTGPVKILAICALAGFVGFIALAYVSSLSRRS